MCSSCTQKMTEKHNIECVPQKSAESLKQCMFNVQISTLLMCVKDIWCNVLPDLYMKEAPERHVNSTEQIMLYMFL